MNITRRKFFFFGLAAGVGLFLPDIKIELWNPTAKQIEFFSEADIARVTLDRVMPNVRNLFESDDKFFNMLKRKELMMISSREKISS
jgi:hypothetical protein